MSAAVQDFGVPLLHRVEFHLDRRKAAAVGLASVMSGCLIAYPGVSREVLLHGFVGSLTAAIALAGAAALITAGTYILLRLFLWRGAAIVIDSHGIQDRRAGDTVMPWSIIHDIRILDRHGHRIGIETIAAAPKQPMQHQGLISARMREPQPKRITVIDTFFLRSRTGNRVLDFVMPCTALAPIDMSETPVSEDTLSADARLARLHDAAVVLFIIIAGVIPAIAAMALLLG